MLKRKRCAEGVWLKYSYTFIDWLHDNRDFKIYDKAWDKNSIEIMDQLYAIYRGYA